MKQKKNIDQLFNERFANHQADPPSHVWDKVLARLEKDKQDRVIAIWWRTAGVAASLALIFSLAGLLDTTQSKSIVEQQPEVKNNSTPSTQIDKAVEINLRQDKPRVAASNKAAQNNAIKPQVKSSDNTGSKNKPNVLKTPENAVVKLVVKKDAGVLSKNLGVAVVKPNNSPVILENKEIINTEVVVPTASSTVIASEEKISPEEAEKQSIYDAIEEQKQLESKEAVANNTNPQENLWEIAPNIAPVYYNTLSQGSSIDASFADNSQSGDVNISYGIGVRYALSDRLKIRSGISNVALSYSTAGIELGDGPVSLALKNIDYASEGVVVIAQDLGTFSSQNQDGTFGDITPKSTNGEAFINQNISYYEVPLELSYTLFDSAFGLDVIGGVSTLLLGNNEVSVTAGSYNEVLGSANNLSSLSFATNIGLGLHYKMSSKFRLNVEPMFKYQLNPYTDSSVSFKPYYLGVYTGLSFKF
ncbi:anti-sigma factor [Flavobacteriaceae bacterium]|nr:anti-sigma factor [Flavobacteriaceae bacterium]MDC1416391.1 anti-sigma factor [Flavobacteriaceae bacterium]